LLLYTVCLPSTNLSPTLFLQLLQTPTLGRHNKHFPETQRVSSQAGVYQFFAKL
jgi:hypothetical protein